MSLPNDLSNIGSIANGIVNSITANSTAITTIIANGSFGTANQVLSSNGTSLYWGDVAAGATFVRQTFTANSTVNTTFTITNGYTVNAIDVYENGIKLIVGTEVTANNGTSITLATSALNNSTVDVVGLLSAAIYSLNINTVSQGFAFSWTNNHIFSANVTFNNALTANSISVGNSTVNSVINSTSLSANSISVSGNATINAIIANGSFGTANQFLLSNGTGIYWSDTVVQPIISGMTVNDGYTEETVTANTSTTYTISLLNGTLQILTLTGNCTFTFPTATAGKSFTLFLKQDATGSRTATWPASVKWPSSTAPTITATASKGDKYVFTADGTYWWGSNAGQVYL